MLEFVIVGAIVLLVWWIADSFVAREQINAETGLSPEQIRMKRTLEKQARDVIVP